MQRVAGISVDHFLAVAMPVVSKTKLEVDFPRVSREILKDRPSAKMAIRLMKQERNEKGGSLGKMWSHAIKVKFGINFVNVNESLYFCAFLIFFRSLSQRIHNLCCMFFKVSFCLQLRLP